MTFIALEDEELEQFFLSLTPQQRHLLLYKSMTLHQTGKWFTDTLVRDLLKGVPAAKAAASKRVVEKSDDDLPELPPASVPGDSLQAMKDSFTV